jgi:hypothetical protein
MDRGNPVAMTGTPGMASRRDAFDEADLSQRRAGRASATTHPKPV